MEYVPGGSLKNLIDKFGRLEESVTRSYTRQLLLGLEYLHRNGVAHRDIKGANCLVGNDGIVKLADFGASKAWRTNSVSGSVGPGAIDGVGGGGASVAAHVSGDIKGTPSWMPPEVIRDQDKSISWRKADVWSLACTTLEISTGKPPWYQFSNQVTVLYHIACSDSLPEFPPDCSDELKSFLALCLQRDPAKRPDITSLILHPFVANMSRSGWTGNVVNRPSTVSTDTVGELDGTSGTWRVGSAFTAKASSRGGSTGGSLATGSSSGSSNSSSSAYREREHIREQSRQSTGASAAAGGGGGSTRGEASSRQSAQSFPDGAASGDSAASIAADEGSVSSAGAALGISGLRAAIKGLGGGTSDGSIYPPELTGDEGLGLGAGLNQFVDSEVQNRSRLNSVEQIDDIITDSPDRQLGDLNRQLGDLNSYSGFVVLEGSFEIEGLGRDLSEVGRRMDALGIIDNLPHDAIHSPQSLTGRAKSMSVETHSMTHSGLKAGSARDSSFSSSGHHLEHLEHGEDFKYGETFRYIKLTMLYTMVYDVNQEMIIIIFYLCPSN